MVKNSKAYAYALWCINEAGQYAPKYVKIQAKEWIDIVNGKNEEAYADDDEYARVERILTLIIHPDLHKPLVECIEFYAAFFIVAAFCTKLKNDEGLDIRYYQTALLEIARKNFKTFYSAIIFIILMITEPPNSRFFSVAPDLLKSSELKKAMKKIIKGSPTLVKEFKILRSEIRYNRNDNEYMPLAYSKDNMDALLANAFLADEAGNMDEYPVEAMRSSQVTLLNKLGIIISTQYPNDNNVMIDEIDVAKRTLDGLMEDKRYFALLYEPDDEFLQEDKWKSEDMVIYQSNPVAVWNKIIFDDIKKKRALAIQYPNKRENYLCKHNNIKYKGLGTEGYVDVLKVKPCRIAEDIEWWKGRKVWIGLDLSQTEDNTAIAMVTEEEGIIYAKVWGFIPSDRKDFKSEKEGIDYERLIQNGEVVACGEEVIDYSTVEGKILNLEEEYGVTIMQIGYDRYNAISSVNKFEEAEYECVEIKQHSSVLHRPTKWLKELILQQNFRYMASIYNLLENNFSNARCTEDTNLNKYVNKKRSSGKVDMVVALINALYMLQLEIEEGESSFTIQVG